MSKRRLGWLLTAGILVVASGVLLKPYLINLWPLSRTSAQTVFGIGDRTLIVAPHPDDETLGGAGVIEKAMAAGKKIKVVIMTVGDGYRQAVMDNFNIAAPSDADYKKLGEIRHLESLKAMNRLGVKAEDVIFLGYPDGGLNSLWGKNWDENELHLGLNGSVRSPYAFSYKKNAPYCGANVVKNLSDIIRDFRPTDVVYPDPNDQHHDHWATNAFVKYTLTQLHYGVNEWTYLIHRGDFPPPWMYKPDLPLNPPILLQNLDASWIYLPMTEKEKMLKKEAIEQYVTQVKVMGSFLNAFVRKNELLARYADPILPVTRKPLDFSNESNDFPYKLFPDAYADTLLKEIDPGADIIALGAVRDNHQFHIGIEAKAPISSEVGYHIRMRLFTAHGVKRLDLNLKDSRLQAERYASNSLSLPQDTALHQQGNRIWVSFPDNMINGVTDIMVGVDTTEKKKHVDKTAWRLIKVAT